jgi:hypothetical protein
MATNNSGNTRSGGGASSIAVIPPSLPLRPITTHINLLVVGASRSGKGGPGGEGFLQQLPPSVGFQWQLLMCCLPLHVCLLRTPPSPRSSCLLPPTGYGTCSGLMAGRCCWGV